jgi:molybdopterin-binding protein
MRISARNQLPGTVLSVKHGAVMTEVVVEIGGGQQLVSVISTGSAKELDIKEGAKVYVIVKSTEVMIGVNDPVKLK